MCRLHQLQREMPDKKSIPAGFVEGGFGFGLFRSTWVSGAPSFFCVCVCAGLSNPAGGGETLESDCKGHQLSSPFVQRKFMAMAALGQWSIGSLTLLCRANVHDHAARCACRPVLFLRRQWASQYSPSTRLRCCTKGSLLDSSSGCQGE